jgi:hypothetical protein
VEATVIEFIILFPFIQVRNAIIPNKIPATIAKAGGQGIRSGRE